MRSVSVIARCANTAELMPVLMTKCTIDAPQTAENTAIFNRKRRFRF